MDEPVTSARFIGKHYIFIVILLFLVFIAGGIAYYYYSQYTNTQNLLKNPNLAVEKQTKQLTTQVGKLMMLPTDEVPTVATVTDAGKLKDQAFFKNAKNGDKVLIYVKARKAILYRASTNLIVDVAPVNISPNQQAPAPSGEVLPTTAAPTVALPTTAPTAAVSPVPTK